MTKLVVATLMVCACAPRARVVVPPESIRELAYMPTPDRYATSRHVIRMSDGSRDWEVEFPDVAVAYEVRIPLRGAPFPGGPQDEAVPTHLTAADREMMEERALGNGNGQPAGAKLDKKAEAKKRSYLGGIARVRELYRTRNYELALIDVVDLEREYPNDAKIMAMKGSIYRKLGKTRLAREVWEKVLAIDPDNTTVADALRELDSGERERTQKVSDDEEGGR